MLSLILERERYERTGLLGKPYGPKATGGIRPKWGMTIESFTSSTILTCTVVDVNLRHPSMVHGKRGFDRLIYAFKNVLTEPVTWLFTDLEAPGIMSMHTGHPSHIAKQCCRAVIWPYKATLSNNDQMLRTDLAWTQGHNALPPTSIDVRP